MQYCNYCGRMVRPVKGFSWLGFIFTFFVPYLLYYIIKAPSCPICGARMGHIKRG